jgi:hypothetical protein
MNLCIVHYYFEEFHIIVLFLFVYIFLKNILGLVLILNILIITLVKYALIILVLLLLALNNILHIMLVLIFIVIADHVIYVLSFVLIGLNLYDPHKILFLLHLLVSKKLMVSLLVFVIHKAWALFMSSRSILIFIFFPLPYR